MQSQLKNFFDNLQFATKNLDLSKINKIIEGLKKIKQKKGRIFFLGVGGSAANCSHAVNDFRKLCNIEAYTPVDNVSELTARINDEGWEGSLLEWLKVSKINNRDCIFIFSVGGGDIKRNVSVNLINCIKYSIKKKIKIFSIVGRKGYAFRYSDVSVLINVNNKQLITPISEAYQAVVWHAIVSDKRLCENKTKW